MQCGGGGVALAIPKARKLAEHFVASSALAAGEGDAAGARALLGVGGEQAGDVGVRNTTCNTCVVLKFVVRFRTLICHRANRSI
jgi:hypothetical protein